MLNKNKPAIKSIYILDISEDKINIIELAKKDSFFTRSIVTKLYDSSNLENQLNDAIEECYQLTNNDVYDILINFSGVNILGFTVVLDYTRENNEEQITEKEMQKIYKNIKEKANSIANYKHQINTLQKPIEFELADLIITTIKLDDNYELEPIGKLSKSIKIAAFCSFIPKNKYHSVVDSMKANSIKINAVTTNYYSLYRIATNKVSNFILLSINETYTEIAIVFGRNIIDTRYVSLGRDFIVDYLSTNLQVDNKSAEGKILGYLENTILEKELEDVKTKLKEALNIYINAIDVALDGMGTIDKLPKNIVFANLGLEVKDLLNKTGVDNENEFSKEKELSYIDYNDIDNLVDDLKVLHTHGLQSLASTIIIATE